MTVAELIAELQGDMTQAEMAALIGVDQTTISKVRLGEIIGGHTVLIGLLRAFPARSYDVLAAFRGDMQMAREKERKNNDQATYV